MKISNFPVVVIVTVLIIMNAMNIHAGYFNEKGQAVDGGTEANLYGFNTLILENTVTTNGKSVDPGIDKTIAIGATPSSFYSKNYKIYYIPVSFTYKIITLSASIPWIFRGVNDDGDSFNASGLGDINVGVSLFMDYLAGINGTTSLKTTFPTGDDSNTDSGFYIPLGSGGYSFNIAQSLSKNFGNFRMYANASIIYSLQIEQIVVGSMAYQFHNGTVYSALLGFEYTLFDVIIFALKCNYVYVAEGQVKTQWTGWQGSKDSLQTSDAIAGITFNVWEDVLSVFIRYVQPIYTRHDPGVDDPKARKFGISFGISGLF